MATFTMNLNQSAWFPAFDIDDLNGQFLYESGATSWRTGPSQFDIGTDVQFHGVGFSYTGGGLTGGTIHEITKHQNGATNYEISDLSLSAATYHTLLTTHDTAGFLNTVFGGADTINGSNQTDYLMGYAGNDHIYGFGGADILDGGKGSDTLNGGAGNDYYLIDSTGDVVQEYGGDSDDVAISTINIDLSKAAYNGVEHASLGGTANLYAYGDAGDNWIYGNDGSNSLKGAAGNDHLYGGAGNDKLDGGTGNDDLHGGAGNDAYTVDDVSDDVIESDGANKDLGGIDTVTSTGFTFILPQYVENLVLAGSAFNGVGNTLANAITGNAGANNLDGFGGADTLTGGNGNDTYYVDNKSDKVVETSTGGTADVVHTKVDYTLSNYVEQLYLDNGAAIDGTGNAQANEIHGNSDNNKIDGSGGNDELFGGAGIDVIFGGAGNDKLHGNSGNDTYDVSAGNDTVYYESVVDGYDVINWFDGNASGGQDVLDLDGYFDDLFNQPEDRAATVSLVDNGNSFDVWIDVNSDGTADWNIATINSIDVISVGQDILVGSL